MLQKKEFDGGECFATLVYFLRRQETIIVALTAIAATKAMTTMTKIVLSGWDWVVISVGLPLS